MKGTKRVGGGFAFLLGVAFPVALALAPGVAEARTSPTHAGLARLGSLQAADSFLRSRGIDPSTAVHQTGVHNYAGAHCPGAGWTCARSAGHAVVQLAAASDGVNRYDCSPSSGGSASTDTCVVVQMSTGGENEAECEEGVSGTAPDASCSITQQSTTGDNEAFAAQWWFQSAGNAQTAAQTVTLTQQSTTGSNEAFVAQLIDQQMRNGAPTQDQEGVQVACVQQDAQSGNDSAAVFQNMLQGEQEQAANTSQTQNQTAGPDTACGSSSTTISPNLAALVLQNENTPTASGSDNERVQQFLGQRELSFPTSGAASQLQGNNADIGGLEAIPNQNSSGVATANTSQAETQFQDAETATRTQTQNDPIHNPPNEGVQGTNPNDTFNLVQRSTQRADSGATQFYDMQGDCVSSGTCNVTQSFSTNTASNTMTCNQSACAVIQSNVGG